MQLNNACRAHNLNLLKFFIREKQYRTGVGIFRYPHWNDEVVNLIIAERAKKEDEEAYDKKRDIYMKKCWERGFNKKDKLTDLMSSQELQVFEENKTWNQQRKEDQQRRAAEAELEYDRIKQITNLNHQEILTKIGVSRSTWYKWSTEGLVSVKQSDGRFKNNK